MTTMENLSGLTPLGRAVLVKMQDSQELKRGVIEIPEQVRKSMAVMEDRATVVEVGSECWQDERAPRAAPGDKVIVTKFAGYMVQGSLDGKLYRLVNDRDIFCRVKEN